MREIKFRVWEPLNKEMHYLDFALYDYKDGDCRFVLPSKRQGLRYYTIMNLDAVEVMQFTGILDVNGKEIYEGDIIDITGLVRGNIYEPLQVPKFGTDIIVTEMGTNAWRGTEQRLLGCGCKYAL